MCVGVCAGAGETLCAGKLEEPEHLLDPQSERPGNESSAPAVANHDLEAAKSEQD